VRFFKEGFFIMNLLKSILQIHLPGTSKALIVKGGKLDVKSTYGGVDKLGNVGGTRSRFNKIGFGFKGAFQSAVEKAKQLNFDRKQNKSYVKQFNDFKAQIATIRKEGLNGDSVNNYQRYLDTTLDAANSKFDRLTKARKELETDTIAQNTTDLDNLGTQLTNAVSRLKNLQNLSGITRVTEAEYKELDQGDDINTHMQLSKSAYIAADKAIRATISDLTKQIKEATSEKRNNKVALDLAKQKEKHAAARLEVVKARNETINNMLNQFNSSNANDNEFDADSLVLESTQNSPRNSIVMTNDDN